MTSAKVLAIIEQLKTLTLAEAAELVAAIEATFGVNAAPLHLKVQSAAAPAPSATATEPAPKFAVVLEAVPANKRLAVLKAVWQASGGGLKHAKALVKSLPSTIAPAVAAEEARHLQRKLEAFGAKVTLKSAAYG